MAKSSEINKLIEPDYIVEEGFPLLVFGCPWCEKEFSKSCPAGYYESALSGIKTEFHQHIRVDHREKIEYDEPDDRDNPDNALEKS